MMGTKLLAGRDFDDYDRANAAPVAIVNASLVHEYFATGSPLGQHIRIGTDPHNSWLTIVGVVEDQKHTQLMHEMSWAASPSLYRPFEQDPPNRLEILTREGDGTMLRVLQKQISVLDPDVFMADWETMEARPAETMKFAHFRAVLMSSFALAAILLAGIGLHGVLAQLVARRIPEFGIRMAIGARTGDIFWLVAKQGGGSIIIGLGGGLLAALALRGYLASLLYEGYRAGSSVMVLVVAVLSVVAIAAILLPAFRASRVDPAVTLRSE